MWHHLRYNFISLTGCHTLCLLLSVSEGECGISKVPMNDFDCILTSFDAFNPRVDIVSLNNMRIIYNI